MSLASRIWPTMPTVGVGSIGAGGRLIIEADIAAGDGNVRRPRQPSARPLDGLLEHVEILGIMRVAEVEIIGEGERLRAGHGKIARAFRDGDQRAEPGLRGDVVGVAIDGGGEIFPGIFAGGDADHGGHRLPGATTVPTRTM